MRRTPLIRRTPLKQGSPIQRAKRVNPVNQTRRARLHREQYGDAYADHIRSLPCLVPDCASRLQTVAAHARSRGAGGKASDLVPLCSRCHDLSHVLGAKTFESTYGVDLRAEAARLWAEWQDRGEAL